MSWTAARQISRSRLKGLWSWDKIIEGEGGVEHNNMGRSASKKSWNMILTNDSEAGPLDGVFIRRHKSREEMGGPDLEVDTTGQ